MFQSSRIPISPIEIRIMLRSIDQVLQYLKILTFFTINVLLSLPPTLAKDVRVEFPIFLRPLDREVELIIQLGFQSPLIRIRTDLNVVKQIEDVELIGILFDGSELKVKTYKSKNEIAKDKDKLVLLYRIFRNADVEVTILPGTSTVKHGVESMII